MRESFISRQLQIQEIINEVVSHPTLHTLWLNTLSFLENCGAKKIAACQHPTAVNEEMLKHASEEFRHAYYLKKQILRLGYYYDDYRLSYLLGGFSAYHYLHRLDIHISRYLISQGLSLSKVISFSYLLVTYVIELRASELYPLYHEALKNVRSPIQVKSILLEEKEHLEEMERALVTLPRARDFIETSSLLEAKFFDKWHHSMIQEIRIFRNHHRFSKI